MGLEEEAQHVARLEAELEQAEERAGKEKPLLATDEDTVLKGLGLSKEDEMTNRRFEEWQKEQE